MFMDVLVGVDGRQGGRDAIALASRLTDPAGKLTLAHVHSGPLHPIHAATPGLMHEEHEASRELLERERSAGEVASAQLLSVVAMSPGRGLHEQAEGENADLIVVGSCSRSAVGRAMLGDDTRAALNGAPCAVAIAPLGYAEHPKPIATVGVAYNSSPESEAALAIARTVAARTKARIQALEVVSIPSVSYAGIVPPAIGETIDVMLDEANGRMRELADVDGRAVYGLPGEELAEFGDEVDILVVGSRGYGPFKRLVLGSTSEYLQRHARCALLVLPRPESSEQDAGSDARPGAGAERTTGTYA
jgi:nucleotide-binding universal stress UspA family protein